MSEKQIREYISWGMILVGLTSIVLATKQRQAMKDNQKKYLARREELERWYDETLMDTLS